MSGSDVYYYRVVFRILPNVFSRGVRDDAATRHRRDPRLPSDKEMEVRRSRYETLRLSVVRCVVAGCCGLRWERHRTF